MNLNVPHDISQYLGTARAARAVPLPAPRRHARRPPILAVLSTPRSKTPYRLEFQGAPRKVKNRDFHFGTIRLGAFDIAVVANVTLLLTDVGGRVFGRLNV